MALERRWSVGRLFNPSLRNTRASCALAARPTIVPRFASTIPCRSSALRTVRGFNVARATGPSMDWLAVSDAEPGVLSAFVQRLAREDIPQ